MTDQAALAALTAEIIVCRRCPRLVEWRERVAREKVARFREVRVLVALGAFGWDAALRTLASLGHEVRPRPRFGHGAETVIGPYTLIGTYHPSQQNTFTGRLTPSMLERVIRRAQEVVYG